MQRRITLDIKRDATAHQNRSHGHGTHCPDDAAPHANALSNTRYEPAVGT